MAKGNGEGKGGGDEMAFVAFAVVAALAVWLVWAKFRHVIVYAVFGLDWPQYAALDALGRLNEHGQQGFALVKAYLAGMDGFNPKTISWSILKGVQLDIGYRMRWLFVPLMVAMAVYLVFKMKGQGFRRGFSLSGSAQEKVFYFGGLKINNSLLRMVLTILTLNKRFLVKEKTEWVAKGVSFMHYQAEHWRVALAGAHFKPDEKDDSQARAATPPEWLRDHGIRLTRRESLDEDAAEAALVKQLGPAWQGIEKASTHVQAMCVLAALNFKRDKKVEALRDRLTEIYILSSDLATADTKVKALLAPYIANKGLCTSINRRCAVHAYTNTAVVGIFGFGGPFPEWGGGEAGVIAPAMFRWLKKVDRTLWYCLQNVGRRAYFIEGAGTISHFFAERVVGGSLAEAHLDGALDGLVAYIEDHGISDLEDVFRPKNVF